MRKSPLAARKPKSQPVTIIPTPLTPDEITQIVERVAEQLGHDSEEIALLTLVFDHLAGIVPNDPLLVGTVDVIKSHLFLTTRAASAAQRQFETDAFKNRGNLLRFPSGRKGAA